MLKFAKTAVVGLVVLTVIGAMMLTTAGKAMVNRVVEAADEEKSVPLLIDEAEAELEANADNLRRSAGEFARLERKRDLLRVQREKHQQQRETDLKVLAYMRHCLEETGDTIEVAHGVSRDRADIERDIEVQLEACCDHDARVEEFDAAIAAIDDGIRHAQLSIDEAKDRLREDTGRLRQLQVAEGTYRIQKRIEGLLDRCTPEAILSDQRDFDRKVEIAESKMAELGTPQSTRVAGWRRWALAQDGKAQSSLVSDVDRYLRNHSGSKSE